MNTIDPKPTAKHANAPKPQDVTPSDLSSALTVTLTPLTQARRADAPATDAPLPVDLSKLTDEVLAAVIEGARATLQQRKAKREADFFALVGEQAKVLGVTPARLAAVLAGKAPAARTEGAVDGRSRVKPKYWNPSNHEQRWSGRGDPAPQWVRELLASGITLEQMLIPEGAV